MINLDVPGVRYGDAAVRFGPLSMKRRYTIAVFGALAFVASGIFAIWVLLMRPVAVSIAPKEASIAVQVFGLGTVEARVQSKIGFKVSGVLAELAADIGDRVTKGDMLARLDSREQQAQVARAKAFVEQGEASLQKALASVTKATANYTNARTINERRQRLMQTGVEPIEVAQTAQAAEATAAADLALAKSDVAVAQAAIDDTRAQMRQQSVTLDFHALTAPYDAMVIQRQKELGMALAAGEPVFTIIDPKTVWVLAYVDESKAGEIALGQPADIVLRSQPSRHIAGHVARIQPESDRVNEERRVEVAFDQIPDDFHLGEQAEVYITTIHLDDPILVPEAAIIGLGRGGGTVWTVEAERLHQREVRLGHRLLDGRYEITAGVPVGASVVTQLRSGLRIGRAAKIVQRQSQ